MIQPHMRASVVRRQGAASVVQPLGWRRSGWGVLAVGALVASVLAAVAVPVGAVTDRADHATRLSACVAAAAEDRMFTDVSAGHAHRAAISCVAYYGITRGTGDGSTYSPGDEVTRAQMAVFIARAAAAAGVDLGSGIGGFNDIGGIWGEARDAIDGLASRGMIRSGGDYRPHDAITRAEMAAFLVGLLAKASPNVTVDSSGAILLGPAGSQTQADDWFPDTAGAARAEAAALYELGVTKGARAAAVQDDTMPPLDYDYDPEGTVDRGQMAAFITRALAHTSVRPVGVTAQYDGAEVVVSVRDRSYRPVPGAAVDVFWATAARADRALLANGACRLSAVTAADESAYPCEIDDGDPVTGRNGDATVSVAGLRRVPAGGAVVWAWTGDDEQTLNAGADVYRLEVAEGAGARFATTTLVTTAFDAQRVRFGDTVTYSLQLTDPTGNVHRGVDGAEPARWVLSVVTSNSAINEDLPDPQTLVSDSSGETEFTVPPAFVTFEDPNPANTGNELTVTYTLTPARNAPPGYATVDADGIRATTGTLTFSDAPSSITTVAIDTPDYIHVTGRGDISNRVTVTVLDQYGDPFTTAQVALTITGVNVTPGAGAVDIDGSRQFSYRYSGAGRATQTLTADASGTGTPGRSETKAVYWTVDAGAGGTNKAVLAGNVHRNHIVVDDNGPVLLAYDGNDRFSLRGTPTSMAAFEAELAEALERGDTGRTLTWSKYSPASSRGVAEYDLSLS